MQGSTAAARRRGDPRLSTAAPGRGPRRRQRYSGFECAPTLDQTTALFAAVVAAAIAAAAASPTRYDSAGTPTSAIAGGVADGEPVDRTVDRGVSHAVAAHAPTVAPIDTGADREPHSLDSGCECQCAAETGRLRTELAQVREEALLTRAQFHEASAAMRDELRQLRAELAAVVQGASPASGSAPAHHGAVVPAQTTAPASGHASANTRGLSGRKPGGFNEVASSEPPAPGEAESASPFHVGGPGRSLQSGDAALAQNATDDRQALVELGADAGLQSSWLSMETPDAAITLGPTAELAAGGSGFTLSMNGSAALSVVDGTDSQGGSEPATATGDCDSGAGMSMVRGFGDNTAASVQVTHVQVPGESWEGTSCERVSLAPLGTALRNVARHTWGWTTKAELLSRWTLSDPGYDGIWEVPAPNMVGLTTGPKVGGSTSWANDLNPESRLTWDVPQAMLPYSSLSAQVRLWWSGITTGDGGAGLDFLADDGTTLMYSAVRDAWPDSTANEFSTSLDTGRGPNTYVQATIGGPPNYLTKNSGLDEFRITVSGQPDELGWYRGCATMTGDSPRHFGYTPVQCFRSSGPVTRLQIRLKRYTSGAVNSYYALEITELRFE